MKDSERGLFLHSSIKKFSFFHSNGLFAYDTTTYFSLLDTKFSNYDPSFLKNDDDQSMRGKHHCIAWLLVTTNINNALEIPIAHPRSLGTRNNRNFSGPTDLGLKIGVSFPPEPKQQIRMDRIHNIPLLPNAFKYS